MTQQTLLFADPVDAVPRRRPKPDSTDRPTDGLQVEQLQDAWDTYLVPLLECSCDRTRQRFLKWLRKELQKW